jgi:predicted RNA binding protein YcfA (HicA-like mRNA interferase family)
MPPFGPVKRRELIACLQRFGFVGPFRGGKHQIMQRGGITLIVPNPHRGDIAKNLLARILHQAGISRDEWEAM